MSTNQNDGTVDRNDKRELEMSNLKSLSLHVLSLLNQSHRLSKIQYHLLPRCSDLVIGKIILLINFNNIQWKTGFDQNTIPC